MVQSKKVIQGEGPIHSVLQALLGWPTLQRNTCNTTHTHTLLKRVTCKAKHKKDLSIHTMAPKKIRHKQRRKQ